MKIPWIGQGRLAQWKNVRFVKSFISSDHGSNLAIRQVFKSFSCAINSHLMHDPEASKYVGKNLATSIGIGTIFVEHTTCGQKGNVAQLNWLYDAYT